MRYGIIMGIIVLASAAATAKTPRDVPISYTENYAHGRLVSFTQGVWDCGSRDERRALRDMKRMAHGPRREDEIARAAGCRRTLDPESISPSWTVVRQIGTVCDERSTAEGSILLPDGTSGTTRYQICGIEAHALLVQRDGERRVAIDVIDFESYD